MRKVHFGAGLYGVIPEKIGEIVPADYAFACQKCWKNASQEIIGEIKAVDIDFVECNVRCIRCGGEYSQKFEFPEGMSAYEFVRNLP
jgi:hypothetical protein